MARTWDDFGGGTTKPAFDPETDPAPVSGITTTAQTPGNIVRRAGNIIGGAVQSAGQAPVVQPPAPPASIFDTEPVAVSGVTTGNWPAERSLFDTEPVPVSGITTGVWPKESVLSKMPVSSKPYRDAVLEAQDREADSGFISGPHSVWDVLAFDQLRQSAIESDIAAMAGDDEAWMEAFRQNPAWAYGELLKTTYREDLRRKLAELEDERSLVDGPKGAAAWLERKREIEEEMELIDRVRSEDLGDLAMQQRTKEMASAFTYLSKPENRAFLDEAALASLDGELAERRDEVLRLEQLMSARVLDRAAYAEALPEWLKGKYLTEDEFTRAKLFSTMHFDEEIYDKVERALSLEKAILKANGLAAIGTQSVISAVATAAITDEAREQAREFLTQEMVPGDTEKKLLKDGDADPLALLAFGPTYGPRTVANLQAQFGLPDDVARIVKIMRGLDPEATYEDEKRQWSYEKYLDSIYGPRPFMKLTEYISSGFKAVGVPGGLADFAASMTLMVPALIATASSGGTAAPLLYGTTAVLTGGLVRDQYVSGHYGDGAAAELIALADWLTMNIQFARPVMLAEDRLAMGLATRVGARIGNEGARAAVQIGTRVLANAGIEVVEDTSILAATLAVNGIDPLSDEGRAILGPAAAIAAGTGAAMPLAISGAIKQVPAVASYPIAYVVGHYGMGMSEEEAQLFALGVTATVVFGRTRVGRKLVVDAAGAIESGAVVAGRGIVKSIDDLFTPYRPDVRPDLPPMTIGGGAEDVPVVNEWTDRGIGTYRTTVEDSIRAVRGEKTSEQVIAETLEAKYGTYGGKVIIDPTELWEVINRLGLPDDDPVVIRLKQRMMEITDKGDIRAEDVFTIINGLLPRVDSVLVSHMGQSRFGPEGEFIVRGDFDGEAARTAESWAAEQYGEGATRVDDVLDVVDDSGQYSIVALRTLGETQTTRYVRVDGEGNVAEMPTDFDWKAYREVASPEPVDVGWTNGTIVVRLHDPAGINGRQAMAVIGTAKVRLDESPSGDLALVVDAIDTTGTVALDVADVETALREAMPLLRPEVLAEVADRLKKEGVADVGADILRRDPADVVIEGMEEQFKAIVNNRLGTGLADTGVDGRVRQQAVIAQAVREAIRAGASEVIIVRPKGAVTEQVRGTMKEVKAALEEVFVAPEMKPRDVRLQNGERGFAVRLRGDDGELLGPIQRWMDTESAKAEGKTLVYDIGALVAANVLPAAIGGVADYIIERLRGKEHEEALVSAFVVAGLVAMGTAGARAAGRLYRVSEIPQAELASELLPYPSDMELKGPLSLRAKITNLFQEALRPERKQTGFTERLMKETNRLLNTVAPAMGRWSRAVFEAKAKGVIEWDNEGVIYFVENGKRVEVPKYVMDLDSEKPVYLPGKVKFADAMANYEAYKNVYGADHPFVKLMRETAEMVDAVADTMIDAGILSPTQIRGDIGRGGFYFPRGKVYRIDSNGVRYGEPSTGGGRGKAGVGALKHAMAEQVTEIEGPRPGEHRRAPAGEVERYVYGPPGEALEDLMREAYRAMGRRMMADVLLRLEDAEGIKVALPPSTRVKPELRQAVAALAAEYESLKGKEERALNRVRRHGDVERRYGALMNRFNDRLKRATAKLETEQLSQKEAVAVARKAVNDAKRQLAVQRRKLAEASADAAESKAVAQEMKRFERALAGIEARVSAAEKARDLTARSMETKAILAFIQGAQKIVRDAPQADLGVELTRYAVWPDELGAPPPQAVRMMKKIREIIDAGGPDMQKKLNQYLRRQERQFLGTNIQEQMRSVGRQLDAVRRGLAAIDQRAASKRAALAQDAEAELQAHDVLKSAVREATAGLDVSERRVAQLAYELGQTEAGAAVKSMAAQVREIETALSDLERRHGRAEEMTERARAEYEALKQKRLEAREQLMRLRRILSEQVRDAMAVPTDQRIDLPEVAMYAFPPELTAPINAALRDQETSLPEFMEVLAVFNNALRTMNATADLSFPMITGLLMTYRDPVAVSKAVVYAVRKMNDPQALGSFMSAYDEVAVARGEPTSAEWVANGLFLSHNTLGGELQVVDLTQTRIGRAVKKLEEAPVIRQANQAFSIMGDMVRLAMAREMYRGLNVGDLPDAKRAGMMRQIVDLVNTQTGYSERVFGDIGAGTGKVAQFVQFAGRFFQSMLNTIGQAAWGTELKNAQARFALLRMFGIGLGLTVLMNDALGQETDFDPRSPNRWRVRIGEQDVSLLGPWDSLVGMFVEAAEAIPGVPGDSQLLFRIRAKMSPIVGIAWDQISGETSMGDDARTPEYIFRRLLPFGVSQLADDLSAQLGDGWTKEKLVSLGVSLVASIFGIKSSPLTPYERYVLAMEADGVDIENPLAVRNWEMEHWDIAGKAHSEEYRARMEKYWDDVRKLDEAFKSGEIKSALDYRNELRRLNAVYAASYGDVRSGDIDKLPEKRKWIASYSQLFDEATTPAGLFDADKMQELEQKWIDTYGEEALAYVLEYFEAGKTGLAKEYYNSLVNLRHAKVPGVGTVNYFQLPRLAPGVLMSSLSEDEVFRLRDAVTQYRKQTGLESADFSDVAKRLLRDDERVAEVLGAERAAIVQREYGKVVNDLINAGKEKYQNPIREQVKKLYPYDIAWFDRTATYADMLRWKEIQAGLTSR